MHFDTNDLTDLTSAQPAGNAPSWPVQPGYIGEVTALKEHIDGFNHVNNMVYQAWAMEAAWRHSDLLGFPFRRFQEIGIGFVISSHMFEYKTPIIEGDTVHVATWIAENDRRLRLTRAYEIRQARSEHLAFKGETLFISIDMSTGKPIRMPTEFADTYSVAEPHSE